VGRIKDPLKIFGDDYPTRDGTCVRDYLHVVDLAKGHVSALEAIEKGLIYHGVKKDDGKNKFRAFNLGTGTAYSVKQMIDAMRRASGFEYQYEVVGRR
jgi:UDP-glucose 4-epimerase